MGINLAVKLAVSIFITRKPNFRTPPRNSWIGCLRYLCRQYMKSQHSVLSREGTLFAYQFASQMRLAWGEVYGLPNKQEDSDHEPSELALYVSTQMMR